MERTNDKPQTEDEALEAYFGAEDRLLKFRETGVVDLTKLRELAGEMETARKHARTLLARLYKKTLKPDWRPGDLQRKWLEEFKRRAAERLKMENTRPKH